MTLDAVLLARIQFAFTISFHIIFPAITIGLAGFLAFVEWRYIKTKQAVYATIYRFWVKIFAICFGLGVVSGVVMSYQFGTNWSVFSDRVGNVIGPLLAYEVLTAFFLEASFLGIMLFGWGRVSQRMHAIATTIVAVGTVISGFWIVAANSWMQTPQGFRIGDDTLLYPVDWISIIFNPSMPYRFAHMIIAAYLTTGFIILGVGAYYYWQRRFESVAKPMMRIAIIALAIAAPLQLVVGHSHGQNTALFQPTKVAAMEGNWVAGPHKPLHLFGVPNTADERLDYAISVPYLSSILVTGKPDGVVPGLTDVPPLDRPPVGIVFWSFRGMVGIGMTMIAVALIGLVLLIKQQLATARWFHALAIAMAPTGIIAVLLGWFVTEVGRQPYSVYKVLRTADSISPVVAESVALTLLVFIIIYTLLFGAGVYYITRLIKTGPSEIDSSVSYRKIRTTL